MEKLGSYRLDKALTNDNAGYCVWGFAKKNGRDYFIKQFVDQKYPANDTFSNPERLNKKFKECERYERRKTALYQTLNEYSDGNAVQVEEFFRVESKYYLSMRKIESLRWGVADIAKLPDGEIRRLCAIIAHSIASLHRGHMVHADLKPDNVLFTKTNAGYITAKIVDFDSGFLETDPPGPGEAIHGDFHYFAPEACRSFWGETVALTCQMDVFAMGVLFHQYFTGELPGFNTQENTYSGEAVAKGYALTVSEKLPDDVRILLQQMLSKEPAQRLTAMEVFTLLQAGIPSSMTISREDSSAYENAEDTVIGEKNATGRNPFFRLVDL